MNECAEISLGPEAIGYIRDCLANGKTLATYLLKRPDLENGSVRTFLPPDVSKEAASQFRLGGKLKRDPETFVYRTAPDGSTTRWEPVPNTDPWLLSILQEFLRGGTEKLCAFENELALPGDPWLSLPRWDVLQTVTFDNEVYHLLSNKDVGNDERILTTVRAAHSWLFIGAMTSLFGPPDLPLEGGTVDDEVVKMFAQRAEKIAVGAYDGESYLIWSKPAS
jgi:hypothetical protein